MAVSLWMIGHAAAIMDVKVTLTKVLLYIVLILLMTVLYYDLELILRTVPFFVHSAGHIVRVEEEGLKLCMKVPGVWFEGGIKIVFYLILPYGVMATIPTQFFAGTLTPMGFAYAVALAVLFTWLALAFWRWGLSHYQSSGS